MENKAFSWKALLVAPVSVWAAWLVSGVGFVSTLGANGSIAATVDSTETISPQPALTQLESAQNSTVKGGSTSPGAQTVAQTVIESPSPSSSAMDAIAGVGELEQVAAPTQGMEQVTSVSQLTDVRPTDWAFQALQSLVERYGCIVGYPDRTYRGNQALTRYEFAAGLNACMDRISELIAAATTDLVRKEDLETLRKLQEEFAAELASLRGRVDALEVRTATLEKQQFSTTTKLSGLAWMNLTGAFTSDDVKFEARPGDPADVRFVGARDATGDPIVLTTDKAEPTLSFLTWLTLSTSFTGKDSLVTQLASGNAISPANQFASAGFFNAFGVPFTDQTGEPTNGSTRVIIHDLFYSFPVNDSIKITVGPRVNWYRHFDFNRYTFFLTGASSFDSIGSTQSNAIDRGSGLVVEWNINPQFRFAVGYLGENTEFLPSQFGFNTSSNPQYGLFGGTNTTTAELTFSPTQNINLRFMYNYTRTQAYGGQIGGAIGEPFSYGYLDAGPGFSVYNPLTGNVSDGGLDYSTSHLFAFNFDWAITPGFGIFGRYGYSFSNLQPIDEAVNVQSFQVGAGFPDLGKKGALGVITFLMPMDIQKGRRYYAAGGGDGGTMYELEASYYYPITDNIAIVPAFYAIFDANNFDDNPTLFVGNVRAQFSF